MNRRPSNPRDAAEAAFRKATTAQRAPNSRPAAVPGVKETVSLRIDQDVLHKFQEDGPGWQDRMNRALREAAGLG